MNKPFFTYTSFLASLLSPTDFLELIQKNDIQIQVQTFERHKGEILIINPFVKAYCESAIYRDDLTLLDMIEKFSLITVQTDNRVKDEAILLACDCVNPPIEKTEKACDRLSNVIYPLAVKKFKITRA